MSTSRWRSAIALGLILLAAGAASAQDVRARVQGVVSDASEGVLPGATVVLTNDGTGVSATRNTNAQGRFLFDFVESGTYSLRAELSGFKAVVQKNVRVQQRGDVTVDLRLEVGGLEETVIVTEATTTVQFNTASRDLTIEQEMVKELPSSTRNPLQLAMLDPTTIQRGSTIETQPYFHRTANEMDIGGGTKYRNDVLLDGTPLTAGNKLGYTPPDGRGERVHDPAELGGRRVRPQRGRHRDRDHEVGHERREGVGLLLRPRLQPQRDRATGRPTSTTTTPTGTPGGRSACRSGRTRSSSSPSSTRSTPRSPRPATTRSRPRWSARATSRSPTTPTARCASSTTP